MNSFHREVGRFTAGDELSPVPVAAITAKRQARRIMFSVAQHRPTEVIDITDAELEEAIRSRFNRHIINVNQKYVLKLHGKTLLASCFIVHNCRRGDDFTDSSNPEDIETPQSVDGLLVDQTELFFQTSDPAQSGLKLKKTKAAARQRDIFQSTANLEELGIGGLGKEFAEIFRRAFASRIMPDLSEQLNIKHVKGVLLYGPPGTGKTLIARTIGKLLKAREPKIVNGPEILNKYVGQSEENVRALFADAEKEQKEKGNASGLHIIILDELDAICKQRGMSSSSSGVGDTVVNQLLSKIDGVNALNNVLLIGMTNRKDMIDEALLRPGRLEVHIEVGLPDEPGRLEILRIHTKGMREHDMLDRQLSLEDIAAQTKNFSGGEIEGLVKSAASWALSREINIEKLREQQGKPIDTSKIVVGKDDFQKALEDVKPAFGVQEERLAQALQYGICNFSDQFGEVLRDLLLEARHVQNSNTSRVSSILLHGLSGSGKSALAAHVAKEAGFGFVKVVSADLTVGEGEAGRCARLIKTFDDAHKSATSLIILDDLERLVDYSPIGPRFANNVLQTLAVLIRKTPQSADPRRCLVIGTTSTLDFIELSGLAAAFRARIEMPVVSGSEEVGRLLRHWQSLRSSITSIDEVRRVMETVPQLAVRKALDVLDMAEGRGEDGQISAQAVRDCLYTCGLL